MDIHVNTTSIDHPYNLFQSRAELGWPFYSGQLLFPSLVPRLLVTASDVKAGFKFEAAIKKPGDETSYF